MAEAGRHPSIKILANTDIETVEGEAGNFTVTVTRRPRYVNEDLCTGCRTCSTYCPHRLLYSFYENLSSAKAIDILCPQAIPAVAAVNREACLFFQGKCTICVPVCKAKAIDFSQKRKKGVMHVGAIIVSSGYEIFDAKASRAYGYGRLKNVMNSLELERLLNASGPHKGEVLRRSDGKIPSKIAWLQCVGSRDTQIGHTYCSGICCTYAMKQMILIKHHYPATEVTIFHNDIRSFGKGFEDFYNRARKLEGARFIRKRISSIKENKGNNNLIVTYASDSHTIEEEEFDMAVLSVGMSPAKDNSALADKLGLELNGHGFCRTDSFSPGQIANRPGIFAAATFTGPMDIPDSISSASGAGANADQLLSGQRGTLTQAKAYPEERAIQGEDPRIGVFICHCGTNIAGVADVSSLVAHAAALKNVVHSEDQVVGCASDALKKMTKAIKEKKLNRVVAAACSPKDHEEAFREALREGGLNPYLLDMANIREQCTWVHYGSKDEANQKAKDIIAMSVARARNLCPIEELKTPVNKKGLVLGGGLAGMKSALSLARQGFEVYLVEKNNGLGGHLANIHYTLEGMNVQPFLKKLIAEVEGEDKIKVFKGCELKACSGYVGNFKSTLIKVNDQDALPVELEHGIIVVATGGKLLEPSEYRFGDSGKIATQQGLEIMIATNSLPRNLKQVAMIQCVGARDEKRPYCSRTCCGEALKNALKIKELNENTEVVIFYRDMRAYGFREDYYLRAREKGVLFIQYEPENKPEVDLKGEDLSLTFYDSTLAMEGELNPDLLVLSTPVSTEGNQELAQLLRLSLTVDGFFMEAHMKLRPLDMATDGIFLCGMAHYPKYIPETISQAEGAALRAATVLSQDSLVASGAVCEIDEDACISCGACISVCNYNAIEFHETPQGKKARVISILCKGDGLCNSKCPTGAVSLKHFIDEDILAQIDAMAPELVQISGLQSSIDAK
jgi:heterodisulfide reductase subunit A